MPAWHRYVWRVRGGVVYPEKGIVKCAGIVLEQRILLCGVIAAAIVVAVGPLAPPFGQQPLLPAKSRSWYSQTLQIQVPSLHLKCYLLFSLSGRARWPQDVTPFSPERPAKR